MNATEIIEKVTREGVVLALSPTGTITATGDEQVVDRWLPTIRDNKPGIVRELEREGRRTKVLAMLGADPGLRYAVHVEDASTDPVLVAVGIRQVATFELGMPGRYYDGMALLELVASYSGAQHDEL
ncbi:MAG: hypothetical protein CRU78_16970 [Candidatus Accumulibacter phosphatis]|uniref:TubC N-terminal docking domain-containing protein n=1 Tax=Candidatus Accumulibacter phosphatis TaxID=327160 RepID=A0A6A7RX93_9PROT|nr:hypothetical protein [Candidatus Accumulibacter phosphatis]